MHYNEKNYSVLFLFSFYILILCSCGKVSVDKNQTVQLVYKYTDANVDVQLSKQESETILDIFDGKELFFDNPSCGFDENISLRFDGRIYCPACDTCCIIKDCSSGQYFDISQSERDAIEEIFEAHGGHFPCV